MKGQEIIKGRIYLSKVVGLQGIRKIRVHSILNNVVTCEDLETCMNSVAKIYDIECEFFED